MTLAPAQDTASVLHTDAAFFEALLAADVSALEDLLTDDFLIVDVMSGQVTARADLLAAIAAGQVQFVEVTRFDDEVSVRRHETAAVVIGRTRMVIGFGGETVTASSRYTHVFVQSDGRWQLLSAQGTPTEQAALTE